MLIERYLVIAFDGFAVFLWLQPGGGCLGVMVSGGTDAGLQDRQGSFYP